MMEPNQESINNLLNARNVAVIGASSDPKKLSSSPVTAMNLNNYQGSISVVNPNHTEIMGHKCFTSIADLPDNIDAAIILLPAGAAVEAAEQCAEKSIFSVVVIAQGFGESGPDGIELDARLVALATRTGMAIVGPNTNGVTNARTGLALSLAPIMQYPELVRSGAVSIISQSGAMVSSLLTAISDTGVGFCKTITCGNELTLNVADYLRYLACDPETNIIVIYLETIRHVKAFTSALEFAHRSGKAVVAIKIGESENAKKAALSHTGAIAGSYDNTIAFLQSQHVYVAEDIESLALIVYLLDQFDWSDINNRLKICVASISGGFAAHIADEASRLGAPLSNPSRECTNKLEALPTQSHGVNPYDVAAQNNLIPSIIEFFREDGFNMLIFGLVLMKGEIEEDVRQELLKAKNAGMSNIIVLSPRISAKDKAFFHSQNIIITRSPRFIMKALLSIETCRSGLELASGRNKKNHTPLQINLPQINGQINEVLSKELLQQVGLKTPKRVELKSCIPPSGFEHLNYPLAIKAVSDKIAHKTEHGLVEFPIRNENELLRSWSSVSENLKRADASADTILIEEFINSGIEVILGVQRDPFVGPVVVIGAGGILCELLDDSVLLIPPFSYEQFLEAISKTKLGRLLNGYRGRKYDLAALGEAAINIGLMALASPRIESLDINPILVLSQNNGVIAVDAALYLLPEILSTD